MEFYGRAANALDENKIAMAKEQIELALADFQTEFFEEKYVNRTNDGTKKEYVSEKLEQGVVTTNFYVQALTDGNVVVYEGKDKSGVQVLKGVMQEDASIKWDEDVKIGDSEESEGTTEGGNDSSEAGGNINSEELATLKATVNRASRRSK